MEGLPGVTARDTKTGGVTVRMAEPLTDPKEAVIAVVPWARLLATPWLLMVATAMLEEFQLTALVRFRVLPSVKVPVALNSCFVPAGMERVGGVTARDAKTGGVTVRVVEPLTDPKEAAIAVVPWARLVVSPWLPVELLIAATAGFEELQVTEVVRFETVPFLKKPVTANCCLSPSGIEGFVGDTEMEASPETEPVPERLVTWGLVAAASVTKSWPVLVPTAVGVNVTFTVHVCPGASVEPQLLVWAKSPLVAMLKIVRGVVK